MLNAKTHEKTRWKKLLFFSDWSKFEKLLLLLNAFISIMFLILSFINPHYSGFSNLKYHVWYDLIATIANLTNVVCIILVAKRNIANYIWGLFAVLTLGIVAYLSRNTGTCLLNLVFYLPMQVIGFIMWHKHTDKKMNVKPRSLKWQQSLLIAGIIVGTVVALGYIFSLPNFQKFWYGSASSYQMYYYFIDAGVLAISIVAMILMVLRYKEQWIIWLIADIAMIILFGLEHQLQMVLTWSTATLNAVYGMIAWHQKPKN